METVLSNYTRIEGTYLPRMTEVMTAIVFCLKQAPGSAAAWAGGQKVTSSSLAPVSRIWAGPGAGELHRAFLGHQFTRTHAVRTLGQRARTIVVLEFFNFDIDVH